MNNADDYMDYLAYCDELRKQGKTPEPYFALPTKQNEWVKIKTGSPLFINKKYIFSSDVYDETKHCLNIFGQSILVPPDSNQDDLCKVLFLKNLSILEDLSTKERKIARQGKRTWNWDEVFIAKGESDPDKKSWREVYNASDAISKLIYSKTSCKEFLIFTTKTVTLNPDYQK